MTTRRSQSLAVNARASLGTLLNQIPFKSDLLLNYNERLNNDLLEEIEILSGKILPSCGQVTPTDYLIRNISDFGNNDASGYIECKFYFDGDTSNTQRLFCSSDTATKTNYILMYIGSRKVALSLRLGATFTNTISSTTILVNAGWYTVRVGSTGSAYYMTINGVLETITVVSGADDGKWFSSITIRDNITFGTLIYSNTHLFSNRNYAAAYVDYNNVHKWYFSGKGLYEYDTIGTLHMTWVGTNHKTYSIEASKYYLDNGWELWQKSGSADEQVPVISDKTQIITAGYSKAAYGDFAASSLEVNMCDCLIDFDYADATPAQLAVMNRSSETYQSILSRASVYYDATNVYRYHITELADPRIYNEFFNVGYAGMYFGKITTELVSAVYYIKSLTGALLYTTDKTGADQFKIMQYCKSDVFTL